MARLLVGALLVALLLGPAGPGGAKSSGLLGIEQDGARPIALWMYDPTTLKPMHGNLALGGHGRSWSFSPDRSRLVLASAGTSTLARPTSLRFIASHGLRLRGDLRLRGETAPVRATSWPRPGRVLVLLDGRSLRVLAVDAQRLKRAGTRVFAPSLRLLAGGRTQQGFALLLAERDAIGPPTLATVDADLRLRTVKLREITAGSKHVQTGNDVQGTVRQPGFAVDAQRRRAFVVSDGQPAAEIDLSTMRVTYHGVAARVSQARTKRSEGTSLRAEWLGNGLIAVAGWQSSLDRREAVPTGLRVIDTRSWTERVVDPAAGLFYVVGATLVAQRPEGVFGYDFAGTPRFASLGRTGWVQTARGRLYVADRGNRVTTIVDGATGTVVGSFRGDVPRLLGDSDPL